MMVDEENVRVTGYLTNVFALLIHPKVTSFHVIHASYGSKVVVMTSCKPPPVIE